MRITVTIARQLGCGGSAIGQYVAAGLKCRCLDREILSQTAQELDIEEQELAVREEKVASFWERMLLGMAAAAPEAPYLEPVHRVITDRDIFENETAVMRKIAAEENCVVVGRGAVHVLPDHPGKVNIFLHAPLAFRIQNFVRCGHAPNEEQARAIIEQSDAARRKFITQMLDKDWSCADNYHLSIDTSTLPQEDIGDLILFYVERKTGVPLPEM
jgi:cytidylate kinase